MASKLKIFKKFLSLTYTCQYAYSLTTFQSFISTNCSIKIKKFSFLTVGQKSLKKLPGIYSSVKGAKATTTLLQVFTAIVTGVFKRK